MTTSTELLRTPLHDWHVSHGGRMVDFAGWSMPVQYKSIVDEHHATRNAVGVFDISHMGRLQFNSEAASQFLDYVVTRRVRDLKPNQIRYGLVCNDDGGILDDVLVYCSSRDNVIPHGMVVNASNREKIVSWLQRHAADWNRDTALDEAFSISDNTQKTAMIAVQGPKAVEVLAPFCESNSKVAALDLGAIPYYFYEHGRFEQHEVIVSRTGYTGEDGFEIICDRGVAATIWERVVEAAAIIGGMACGLGARDTLRLEAAMPLYGHELSEAINPIQAGLNFAVNLKEREFVGREAIQNFAADKSRPVRIGLQVEGKRVARQESAVLQDGQIVGEVSSGTFSPTLNRPIAMAYVQPAAQAVGTRLAVDIRGTQHAAVVVPLPFYHRGRKD